MAKFTPPFGTDGDYRLPTVDEQEQGFGCGAADRRLFTGLYRRIEAELRAIQDAGGIPGSDVDDTTVLDAINALIAAATGGGDTSNYVLFTQAQTRLPIFPEISTVDGLIGINAPATGTIRVPSGITFLHRGIRTYVTAQTDFATNPSKTYHLRWQVAGGVGTFVLKDLADGVYNPTVAAESDPKFDSTYDDMLVARIVTNSGNVATITTLSNKNVLTRQQILNGSNYVTSGGNSARADFTDTFNWARTPTTYSLSLMRAVTNMTYPSNIDSDFNIVKLGQNGEANPPSFDITRYRISQTIMYDTISGMDMQFSARA